MATVIEYWLAWNSLSRANGCDFSGVSSEIVDCGESILVFRVIYRYIFLPCFLND